MSLPSFIRTLAPTLLAMIALLSIAAAQTETEAPTDETETVYPNGFQFGIFGGGSYNTYRGGWYHSGDIEFTQNESSFSAIAGASVSIPLIFEELALYLRAGYISTTTDFSSGRYDSLNRPIGHELRVWYDLFHVDVLFRLIGKQNGERVYFGPSFGFVRKKSLLLKEVELGTGTEHVLQEGEIPNARTLFPSFVIGAEYALIPLPDMYVIPALEVCYGLERITEAQPLRTVYYKLLVTVSYQLF